MKLKMFLPGLVLLVMIGAASGYSTFVQLDVIGISHSCCSVTSIRGTGLKAKICENSTCTNCQGEVSLGSVIQTQSSYTTNAVDLTAGQRFYFCLEMDPLLCRNPAETEEVVGLSAAPDNVLDYNLETCSLYRVTDECGEVSRPGYKLTGGCDYSHILPLGDNDPSFDCWTLGIFEEQNRCGLNPGFQGGELSFAFPFIAG
jgi:hypothetical protein